MKKLIVASLCILCGCVHLHPTAKRNPAQAFTPVTVSDALQPDLIKLEAILRPRVVRLDREMITFHYEGADSSDYVPHSLQDLQRRMSSGYLEKYFDATVTGSYMAGPGEYVAMDAFSTRDYGRETPQLYVIPIAEGATILDTSGDYRETEQSALEEIWKRACDSSKSGADNFDEMVNGFRTNGSEDCRRLIIRAVQDLGVQGILYGFAEASTLAECRHNRNLAINLIRHDAIVMDDLAYYDDRSKIEGRPMSGSVARLYKEAMTDPTTRRNIDLKYLPIPASLKDASTAFPFYRFWKRHKIFRCGRAWALDGNDIMNTTIESLYSLYQDPSLLKPLAELSDAFKKRFSDNTPSFELSRINQIEKLSYEADLGKGNASFDQWEQAQNIIISGEDVGGGHAAQKAAVLLGESIPKQTKKVSLLDVFQSIVRILRHTKPNAAVIPEALSQLNYGPRLARMQSNYLILSLGGTPFLKGPLPNERNASDVMRANRNLFLDLIKTCTEQYLNMSISNDDIQKGPCGLRPPPPQHQ